MGITGSTGEDRLSWGILYSAGELCYSLFVGEINPVGEINLVDEYLMNYLRGEFFEKEIRKDSTCRINLAGRELPRD